MCFIHSSCLKKQDVQWRAWSNYFQARLKTLDCLPVPAVFRVPQELLPRSRAAGCLVNDVAWCGRLQKKLLMGAALCNTFSRSQVSSTNYDRDAHFILDVPFISFVVIILYFVARFIFWSGVKPCSYHGCSQDVPLPALPPPLPVVQPVSTSLPHPGHASELAMAGPTVRKKWKSSLPKPSSPAVSNEWTYMNYMNMNEHISS